MEARDGVLPRRTEEIAARHRVPEGARTDRRDRGALSHRLRAGRLAGPEGRVSRLRAQVAGGGGPGDRQRGQALRPLPRPHHVPDPERARRGDRLRRPRDRGRGRTRNTSIRPRRRCSRRGARSTAWCRRATRCAPPAACWWSRATWTWSRWRSSASATRWRRSAPRPRRCTCPSCCA